MIMKHPQNNEQFINLNQLTFFDKNFYVDNDEDKNFYFTFNFVGGSMTTWNFKSKAQLDLCYDSIIRELLEINYK